MIIPPNTTSAELTLLLKAAIQNNLPNSSELYNDLYDVHSYAHDNCIPVIYPDSVPGNDMRIIRLLINSGLTSLPLSEYTDFNGWTFEVTNTPDCDNKFYLFSFSEGNEVLITEYIDKRKIDVGLFDGYDTLESGCKLLIIEDQNLWTYRNDTPDTYFNVDENTGAITNITPWSGWTNQVEVKRRDIMLINEGLAETHPIAPYNNNYSSPLCKYVVVSKNQKHFKNIIFRRLCNNKVVCLLLLQRTNNFFLSNIYVDTCNVNSGSENDSCISIYNSTNITIKDYSIQHTYSSVSKHGYGIDMNTVTNVKVVNMEATRPNWGVFGNNNINTALLENCSLNRFDLHCYGCNITCRDCVFKNDNYLSSSPSVNGNDEATYHIYNRFSSLYGALIYENCLFDGFYPFLSDYSYNIHSGFFVKFHNCNMKIYQNKYAYLFKMGFWGAPTNSRHEHELRCLPNVLIDGMNINVVEGISTVHLFFLMDRFDWNWGTITQKLNYTSSLHIRNLSFQNIESTEENQNVSLKEINLTPNRVKYAQRVHRMVNHTVYGIYPNTGGVIDNNSRFDLNYTVLIHL